MNDDVSILRWVTTPVACMVGAALATVVVGKPPLPVAVLLALAVGALVAYGADVAYRMSQRLDRVPPPPPPPANWTPAPAPPPYPPRTPIDPRPGPVPPASQWWDRPQSPVSLTDSVASRPLTPSLDSYLPANGSDRLPGRIPQCPRCGDFGVTPTVATSGGSYRFRCRACAHEWTWKRGSPWPAVRVNPRLRA